MAQLSLQTEHHLLMTQELLLTDVHWMMTQRSLYSDQHEKIIALLEKCCDED